MFILIPLTITGIIAYAIHCFLWEDRGNQGYREFKADQANLTNDEELAQLRKLDPAALSKGRDANNF